MGNIPQEILYGNVDLNLQHKMTLSFDSLQWQLCPFSQCYQSSIFTILPFLLLCFTISSLSFIVHLRIVFVHSAGFRHAAHLLHDSKHIKFNSKSGIRTVLLDVACTCGHCSPWNILSIYVTRWYLEPTTGNFVLREHLEHPLPKS